jgi:penicillin-binding protein 2
MITAAAGLEEGVITPDTYITDLIVFDKVEPSASCWSTQYSHGSIEVTEAIKESCNYFFYEVGFLLGIDSSGYYNSEYGIQRLRKYMALFGLDRTSGIELDEASPTMSDMDPVLSAIGQARNSYTPAQLARYITAVASKGDLYNLSILSKLTDSDDQLIEEYTPELIDHIDFKESTWNAIFNGMYKVIGNSSFLSVFSDLDVEVAGKSGTAQENALRPDHGLFVSFAPYDDPEITVTVVLPYGYGSYNSGSVAKNMLAYVFHENEAGDGTRHASNVDGNTVSD